MEIPGLLSWTLSARLDAEGLELGLGDGRRLALRARRAVESLRETELHPTAAWLGPDLSARLAASETRVLHLQLGDGLDSLPWEALDLGPFRLGERFVVSRQPISDSEAAPLPEMALADALSVAVVHRGHMPAAVGDVVGISIDSLDQPAARALALDAHVLVLEQVSLQALLDRVTLPLRPRLVLLQAPEEPAVISAVLDRGATVLTLPPQDGLRGNALDTLAQLRDGLSVGMLLQQLYRHNAATPFDARLHGDPALRFVRSQAPDSRRQVTSLSFDVVGSTVVMKRIGDETYSDMLADLHARCADLVRHEGGQPRDAHGNDGVMCYFGHPAALEDAAVHAVSAAHQIVQTAAQLGFVVRVGVTTGDVAIRAGLPVGSPIHLAGHLQQAATPGTILISESTHRLVRHAFDLQRLTERPPVKHIDADECLYRVVGPSADAQLHRLERQSWLTPLVGREAELERLELSWRELRRGACGLVVVRGEAGMGKSRLVREFRGRLVQRGVKVFECRCRLDASTSPFLALAEALRHWLGIGAGDADEQARQKIAVALPVAARAGAPMDLLAALLGLAPQPEGLTPARARQRMLGVLLDWFVVFAQEQPCCLIVEDWHWVDPSTREFVEQLVQRSGGPGLLVVVTMRTESEPAAPRCECCALIELGGLTPEAARELVHSVSTRAPMPAALVRALAARGDGVPLFLEEAARMAHELGPARLAADAALLEAVPASLQDLLTARLDSVGAAKVVAQVAAVLGREFSPALLAALMEGSRFAPAVRTLGAQLAVLEASGLVRLEAREQYAFKHALVRDAAYSSLWARDRRALHARMVQLLQQRWPELAAGRPELLAHHQTEAGLHTEALAQWELAARGAAARSAELEAISHLRRALALLPGSEGGAERDRMALRLQLMLAARLIATEGYGAEAVSKAYLEAGRLCEALGDETARFKVEMGLEAYRFMRADFGPALEHGRRAAAIAARSGDTKQRLHAHWGLACTLFHQGNLRATMREMETGLALYSPTLHHLFGVQDPGVMCLAYSSWGLWESARPDAAVARINHAIGIAAEFEHKFSQAVAQAYAVSIHLLRGEPEPALARADSCIAVCEEAGFPVWLAITRCMRGRLLCERGEFEAGIAEMRAGYALWLSTGSMVSQPLYLALQAEGLALAGEFGAAIRCVDEGLSIAGRYGERQYEAELRRLRGEFALERGEAEVGEGWIRSAHALALRQHRFGFALRSATSLARLYAADGRHARARRLLKPLLARWHEGLDTRDLRSARALCEALR